MEEAMFRIGQLAKQSGVNIQTVRYYERRGLLKAPRRRPSGYREYGPDAVRRIRFVKRAQELGFSLNEVEELLRLREDKFTSCSEVRAAAVAKIKHIEAKLRNLRAMKHALNVLVRSCAEGGTDRSRPIMEALDSGDITVAASRRESGHEKVRSPTARRITHPGGHEPLAGPPGDGYDQGKYE